MVVIMVRVLQQFQNKRRLSMSLLNAMAAKTNVAHVPQIGQPCYNTIYSNTIHWRGDKQLTF